MRQHLPSVLGFVVAVWLIYLSIEVARHVNAWPFN
jgi:uncharacterized membrane protein